MAGRKNAAGGGSIRQRPDGRWEARFTTGRDPGTGKQIQRSVYGSTQKEVRQKLAQAVAEIDRGTYTAPSKLTVGQWLDIWHREYLGGVKPRTVDSYRTTIRVHILPALGAIRLDALTAPAVQSIPSNSRRLDNGFLPPPGFRLYVFPSTRCR